MFSRGHSTARAKLGTATGADLPAHPALNWARAKQSFVLQVLRKVPQSSIMSLCCVGRGWQSPARAKSKVGEFTATTGGQYKKPEALRQLLRSMRGCQRAGWEKCPV